MAYWQIMTFAGLSVFFVASLGGIAWASWGLRQNARTSKERQALIDAVFDDPPTHKERWQRLDILESVPYDAHLSARMWRRDPFLLYRHSGLVADAKRRLGMSVPA